MVNRKLYKHAYLITCGDTVKVDEVLRARRGVGAELTPQDCRFWCGDVEVVFKGAPNPILTVCTKADGHPLSKSPATTNVKVA